MTGREAPLDVPLEWRRVLVRIVQEPLSGSEPWRPPLTRAAYLMAVGAGILFGLATPASKALLADVGPFTLAGLLYLGAALAILAYRFRRRDPLLPSRQDMPRLVGSVVLGGMVGPVLLLVGLRAAQAASVSVWLNLELVWTAALGAALFKEHIGRWTVLAIALVVAASTVLALQDQAAGLDAGLLVALACLAWAADNQFTARITSLTAPAMTLWKGLAAGTTNLALGFLLEPAPAWDAAPWALAIGVASYGLSIVWYVAAARRIGATRAQVAFSTAPLWGVLAAVGLLGEPWTWRLVAAVALVAVALACLGLDARRPTT